MLPEASPPIGPVEIAVLDYTGAVCCNENMITRTPYPAIRPPEATAIDDFPISASDAHQAAGITYRQCDHWARKGWVRPSIDPGSGRAGRRQYRWSDVVRLDLLRHLAESKVSTAAAGPAISDLTIPDRDVRILWNLLGGDEPLQVVDAAAALQLVEAGGAWVVYNPAEVRAKIDGLRGVLPAISRLAELSPSDRTKATEMTA